MTAEDQEYISDVQRCLGADKALEAARIILHDDIDAKFLTIRENPIADQIEWFKKHKDTIYGIPSL